MTVSIGRTGDYSFLSSFSEAHCLEHTHSWCFATCTAADSRRRKVKSNPMWSRYQRHVTEPWKLRRRCRVLLCVKEQARSSYAVVCLFHPQHPSCVCVCGNFVDFIQESLWYSSGMNDIRTVERVTVMDVITARPLKTFPKQSQRHLLNMDEPVQVLSLW